MEIPDCSSFDEAPILHRIVLAWRRPVAGSVIEGYQATEMMPG
jgi:hypothetical protein